MSATLTVTFEKKPDAGTLKLVLLHLSQNAERIPAKEVRVQKFYINEGGSQYDDAIVACPFTVRLEEKS